MDSEFQWIPVNNLQPFWATDMGNIAVLDQGEEIKTFLIPADNWAIFDRYSL